MKNLLFTGALLGFFLSGCGTTTGNALIKSASFSTAASALAGVDLLSTPVFELKFCAKKIQLQDENEEYKKKYNSDEIAFTPGLVNLSSGDSKEWGKADLPVGFKLKRIKIHIHKDPSLCGVDYSVKFNDASTVKNVVLKWKFNPVIDFKEGETLTLSMAAILTALRSASNHGSLSNESIKDTLEESEDSAEH